MRNPYIQLQMKEETPEVSAYFKHTHSPAGLDMLLEPHPEHGLSPVIIATLFL
jgi:hypothetical protein